MLSPQDILNHCDECAAVPTLAPHINQFTEYAPEYTISHQLCDACLDELLAANRCGDCALPQIQWLPNHCQCSTK